jgi:multidrug efflux pump subunit AcrA (membrane-fusion protein)
MKKFIILSLMAICLPILFFIAKNKEKQPQVKQVSSQEEISEPLILPGEIKADRQVTLRFQTSGLLTWVGVKEGEEVKKGQTLASLDKREIEKNIKK